MGPSDQTVDIEHESLPTGMERPAAGQNSIATARTVSKSAASWPGSPQAAIQLAESLISPISGTPAEARLRTASATASRPEAGASTTATGARSPHAIAAPS